MAYQFKIQLKNVTKPSVWRQVIVPGKITFHKFHQLIQLIFGWEDYHLYHFCPKGYGSHPLISIPSPEDWDQADYDSRKLKINQIFTAEKQSSTYIYDFGDDWVHHIVVEKILADETKIPVCLAGKGACPPEDCGGPWGYENLKTILADPKHEEHADMKEWLGMEDDEEWDADCFDIVGVNEMLKRFK